MSKNLGYVSCAFCPGEVRVTGPVRSFDLEFGAHILDEYQGMEVADAECVHCEAPYLAWISDNRRLRYRGTNSRVEEDGKLIPFDLSHRFSFDDEPSAKDYPKYTVKQIVRYDVTPWMACSECGGPSRSGITSDPENCHFGYKHRA